jgi:hypothetical protein
MNTKHNEERIPSLRLTRQQHRATARKAAKRTPRYLLPSRYTETAFLARLEARPLSYLGRQQTHLKRLLANCDRLIAEHGGAGSVIDQAVARDRATWERQLALVQGLIVKRTRTPAKRDTRTARLRRLQKVG